MSLMNDIRYKRIDDLEELLKYEQDKNKRNEYKEEIAKILKAIDMSNKYSTARFK